MFISYSQRFNQFEILLHNSVLLLLIKKIRNFETMFDLMIKHIEFILFI